MVLPLNGRAGKDRERVAGIEFGRWGTGIALAGGVLNELAACVCLRRASFPDGCEARVGAARTGGETESEKESKMLAVVDLRGGVEGTSACEGFWIEFGGES